MLLYLAPLDNTVGGKEHRRHMHTFDSSTRDLDPTFITQMIFSLREIWNRLPGTPLAFLILLVSSTLPGLHSAKAQAVSSAKIHGVVTDTSGAVVPNATVVATQVGSGQSATTVSSPAGEFLLPNLPVGAYV